MHRGYAQGIQWALVVGTKRSVWMADINTSIPMTIGLVVGCGIGYLFECKAYLRR